jgi:hypothetical protein
MRLLVPPQSNLFKVLLANELSPSQRAKALEPLKALLKEAMSDTEAGSESTERSGRRADDFRKDYA